MMHGGDGGDIKALRTTAWLTGIYFIIEIGIGLYTGSIAVISDALHTFSAVGGVLLSMVAGRVAMRQPDFEKTFGLLRAEVIGALLNGFFLLGMAFMVLWMGYNRLQSPMHLPTIPILIAAAGGLITEFISIGLLYRRQKGNLNVRGAFWHILQTFVGSLIIITVAVVLQFTDFLAIDPLLGMLFGLVLIYASWGIIKESIDILLETTPKGILLEGVKEALLSIPGVKELHHMHAWTLTSGVNIYSTHLLVEDLSKAQGILDEAHRVLNEEHDFYFSTIQVEEECTSRPYADMIDIEKQKKEP